MQYRSSSTMRATPRTWPSIRLRRASWDFLNRSSILEPYPRTVYFASMTSHHCTHDHVPPQNAIDPVCGMAVKIAGARNTMVHDGHTFYFCNPKCLTKFSAEPARYLREAETLTPPVDAGTMF